MVSLPEIRQALRIEADRLRELAGRTRHAVAAYLYRAAAARYDLSAADAMRAEQTAIQAKRYEDEPGGKADAS